MSRLALSRPRAIPSVVILGTVLLIGSGTASATPFLEDFEIAPFAGTPTSFTVGDFTFTFQADGDGGDRRALTARKEKPYESSVTFQ